MAFSELLTVESTPGTYQVLASMSQASKNYLIQNLDLADDDIAVWGFLIFKIYIPNPVDEQSAVMTRACYNRSEVEFNVAPFLGTLNLEVGFYAPQRTIPKTIRLLVE